jgi:cerevisin
MNADVIAANGGAANPLPAYYGGGSYPGAPGSGAPGSDYPGGGGGGGAPGSGAPGSNYPGGGSDAPGSGAPGSDYPGGGSGSYPGAPGAGAPGSNYPGGGPPGGDYPGYPGCAPGASCPGGPGYPGGAGYPGYPSGSGEDDDYPGPIPAAGNKTPFQTGTSDGAVAGPNNGIFDGMGMYAGTFPGTIYDALMANPDVSGVYADTQGFIAVEHNQTVVHTRAAVAKDADTEVADPPATLFARLVARALGRRGPTTIVKQKTATWNLARLAYHVKPTGANATLFPYNSTAGAGVDIYLIDTGIFIGHSDFGGRAKWGKTVKSLEGKTTDDNGHGTHLAAIAAGARYGVAKAANLVAVKVASDSGAAFASDVVAGIHWTIGAVKASKRPSVISFSLGSAVNGAIDAAAEKAVKKGIHFVAAAGNDGGDGSAHSPARSPQVIAVGAFDDMDAKAPFSNAGSTVDIWAPGVSITSAWLGRPDASAALSGTSMAAPHVAGLIAYVIGMYGNQKPAEMKKVRAPPVSCTRAGLTCARSGSRSRRGTARSPGSAGTTTTGWRTTAGPRRATRSRSRPSRSRQAWPCPRPHPHRAPRALARVRAHPFRPPRLLRHPPRRAQPQQRQPRQRRKRPHRRQHLQPMRTLWRNAGCLVSMRVNLHRSRPCTSHRPRSRRPIARDAYRTAVSSCFEPVSSVVAPSLAPSSQSIDLLPLDPRTRHFATEHFTVYQH